MEANVGKPQVTRPDLFSRRAGRRRHRLAPAFRITRPGNPDRTNLSGLALNISKCPDVSREEIHDPATELAERNVRLLL